MAAPTYDSSASTFSGANVASLTTASWTIAGSDRYLVAGVSSAAVTPVNPSAVKWGGSGGTALTQFGSTLGVGSFGKASLWGLKAPSASTTTLYCSWGSNQDETTLMGTSANGVDQTTSTGTMATATGASNNSPTVNVTTVADDFVVDFIWGVDSTDASPTIAVGAGQTSRQEVEGASLRYEAAAMSTEVATGTSTTMSWTITVSPAIANWGILAIGLKPVAAGGTTATPGIVALTLASFAPSVVVNKIHTPGIATLTIAGFAPSVVVNTTVTPSIATLTLTGFAPTVTATANLTVTPSTASLALTGFAPTVTATGGVSVTPSMATLALTGFAPTISVSDHILVTPDTASLTLTGFAPTVSIPGDTIITPDTASLTLTSFAPTVEVSIDDVPVVIIGGGDAPKSSRMRRKDRHELFHELEATVHGLLHPAELLSDQGAVEGASAARSLDTERARRAVDELVVLAEGQHQLIQRAAALRAELAQVETARREQEEEDEFLMFM